MSEFVFVSLTEGSLVGAARRDVTALGEAEAFDDASIGRLAVVVTELAANVLAHAGRGELFARPVPWGDGGGIEITVVDRGPGMVSVERAMGDGFSTADSSGTGLGAVRRMSDEFHVHSEPGVGTVATAVVRRSAVLGEPPPPSALGALMRPHPHEHVSGDAWAVRREGDRFVVAVVDGLGHGPGAEEASDRAVDSFRSDGWEGTEAAVERMHAALRDTRGAVGGVLELDRREERVRFTGVGNVSAAIVGHGGKRSMVSMNGTLGLQMRKIREYEYPCEQGCVVVLHTDGITGRWGPDRVAELVGRSPALLCGALYLHHYRGRDDAAVVAVSFDRLRDGVGRGAS